MDSYLDSPVSFHPHSLNLKNLSIKQNKKKLKRDKNTYKFNLFHDNQRKKGDFNYLEKYVHLYFISFYKNTKDDYNIRMIEDILNNESTHLVAEFKDYLIMGDITEFLQKTYSMKECQKYLPKIYDYYNSCSVIFPNYVMLHESKYIYKNIRKKQKVIDNQQKQEEMKEKIKNGEFIFYDDDDFFSSKTVCSILEQTNTSYAKKIFGIKNKDDVNETPNNIMEKIVQAEKEADKFKINLVKNNSNLNINNNKDNKENKSVNNNNKNITNSNGKKKNNSKISNKNKYVKERNKNNINIHYLSQIQNLKINNKINNSKINQKRNIINNYFLKENDSKKHIKSNSSINDKENDAIKKQNYVTFYGDRLINSKKNELKKLLYENSNKKYKNFFINNKNIEKQYINSLLPNKAIIQRLFSGNINTSIPAHNAYNFFNKKIQKKKIVTDRNMLSISPSFITIQANSFKKNKKYDIKMNLKESKSTRNIINNNLNINNKSKSKENKKLKYVQKKINRNKSKINNYNLFDYNSSTLPNSTNLKTRINKGRIKKINKNNSKINSKYLKTSKNNLLNFKTIVDNSRSNTNINNKINVSNNNKPKNKNMHKINSTSNIKNPLNMNININMNNNNNNKICLHEGSCTNMLDSKLFTKSPLTLELETIKVNNRKKIFYPKGKKVSDASNNKSKNININNLKYNIFNNKNNANSNKASKDKIYYLDSWVHNASNSNNQNDEIIAGGYCPTSTINVKRDSILEELNRKKNIILPYKKEINNINININDYNIHGGSLTSRTSNNVSKKKTKKKNNLINKKE